MRPRIIEEEWASLYGRTVKLHLKEADGSFKNHYHRYKTEEKARKMYECFMAGIKYDDKFRKEVENEKDNISDNA